MSRTSMATLITGLRLLIGDPVIAGTPPTSVFSDDELQAFLDDRRAEVTECQLAWRPSTAPGGTVSYHDFYAPRGDWEDTVVLKDRTYGLLTADVVDLTTGHWTFTANQIPPIFITGITYDLSGSAFDVTQTWAARLSLEFDFTTDQQGFSRSQKFQQLLVLSNEFARGMLPKGMRAAWRADIGNW